MTMTVDNTPPSPPGAKHRGQKIRRFVKRVASFASMRNSNNNNIPARGSADPRTLAAETVPEHPSPHTRSQSSPADAAHDDAAGRSDDYPTPPLQPQDTTSPSADTSATATPRSPQDVPQEVNTTTYLSPSPYRSTDDDVNSVRSGSGYMSDSQESSFSGLSALPSDYSRLNSAAASPLQARKALPTLDDTSLDHRLSSSIPLTPATVPAPAPASDAGARVDTSAVNEPARPLDINAPRIAVFSEGSHDADRTPIIEAPLSSLLLDTYSASTPRAPSVVQESLEEQEQAHTMSETKEESGLDDIPALGSLTQLSLEEFGGNNSSSLVCAAEDEREPSSALTSPEAISDATPESAEDFDPSPSPTLPLEPTLPAIPEAASGADPEYLDLDLPAEADVYTVGQPDLVSPVADLTEEAIPTQEEAFAEARVLAIPMDAPLENKQDNGDVRPAKEDVTATTRPATEVSCVSPSSRTENPEPLMLPSVIVNARVYPVLEIYAPVESAVQPKKPDVLAPVAVNARVYPAVEIYPTVASAAFREPLDVNARVYPEIEIYPPVESVACPESLAVNARIYPEIEIYPSIASETHQEVPSYSSSVPILSTMLVHPVAGDATPASLVRSAMERPGIECLPSSELDDLVRAELPSSSTSSIFHEEDLLPKVLVDDETETALERPVIESLPPPEIDALIAAEVPSTPPSWASSRSLTPLPDASEDVAAASDADLPKVDQRDEQDASYSEHALEAAVAASSVMAAAKKPIEEIVPSEHVEEFGHAVTSEAPEDLVATDAAIAGARILDHADERPVMERFPTEDDELAIAAIIETLPPVEVNKENQADSDRASSESDSDDSGADFESTASSTVKDEAYDVPAAADSRTDTPASAACDGAIADGEELLSAEPAEILITHASEATAAHPEPPVEKDLPELIPSLPTSSNSSEYGDELEDPPSPNQPTPAVTFAAQGPKHLPLANRTPHLEPCYSLTWWLSKHPMF